MSTTSFGISTFIHTFALIKRMTDDTVQIEHGFQS